MSTLPMNDPFFLNLGGQAFPLDTAMMPGYLPAGQQPLGPLDKLLGPYAGLLGQGDRQAAISRGLLGAGAALLQASGPSPVPISTGQAIGQAIPAGFGAADQYANRQAMNNLAMLKLAQMQQQGRGQYFSPIPTPQGVRAFSHRAGTIHDPAELAKLGYEMGPTPPVSGFGSPPAITDPVVRTADDPKTQAALSAAKGAGDVAGRGVITPVEKKGTAMVRVSKALNELGGLYNELREMGGIVDVDKSESENLSASMRSSDIGQFFGKRVGTREQSIRNQINQIRPTLLNYLRQASEQGARGLDSEKELEFYLQAATDTQRDWQSNIAALKVLNDAYGLSGELDQRLFRNVSQNEISSLRNEFSRLTSPQPRSQSQSPGPARTWTEGDFEYRRLPDGTVQRRKIR